MRFTTLFVDGMCMMHRASAGFQGGPNPIAFNFFRSLRALVRDFSATRVVVALEGSSKRKTLDPQYKSNRSPKSAEFYERVSDTVKLLSEHFPVSVVRHPEREADDVIATLVQRGSSAVDRVIVSTDRDYLQLVASQPHVSLWDPVRAERVAVPEGVGDFLVYRALAGDGSDCVPKLLPSAEAALASCSEAALADALDRIDPERFALNLSLLRFESFDSGLESSAPKRDWDSVGLQFKMWGFESVLKKWPEFVATFDPLWARTADEGLEGIEKERR